MPGFLTHYLFGQQIMTKLDTISTSKTFQNAIMRHPNVFNLGTQGPDLFFYYLPCNLNPKKKLGSVMHRSKAGAYFSRCLDYLSSANGKEEIDIFTAYLAGMFCHYALDQKTHPFIYARSGYLKDSSGGLSYLADHCQYESNLDSIMLWRLKHRLPSSFDSSRRILLTKKESRLLAKALSDTVSTTFFPGNPRPYTTRHFMLRAIRHFPVKVEFLRDTGRIKRPVLEWIEVHTVKAHVLTSLFTTDKPTPASSILNLDHSSWRSPWNLDTDLSSSFLDLYREALRFAASSIRHLSSFYGSVSSSSPSRAKETVYKKQLLKQLGSYSYNSGLTTP